MHLVVGSDRFPGRTVMETIGAEEDVRGHDGGAGLEDALRGVRVVHHCAEAWPPTHRLRFRREPAAPTVRLLEAARAAGVRRLIHLSTAQVFGPDHSDPISEATPLRPLHAYERLKAREEEWLRAQAGIEVVVLRPAQVVGPGDDAILGPMLRDLVQGRLRLIGGGRSPRTFLAAQDLGRACIAAARRGRAGATYLVGGFDACWRDLFELAQEPLRVPFKLGTSIYDLAYVAAAIRELRTPVGERCWPNLYAVDLFARKHVFEGSPARRELTWSPRVAGFEDVLADLVEWQRTTSAAAPS